MTTMATMNIDETREQAIDAELAREQADRDAKARALKRAEHIERERLAAEAEEYAKASAARASFLERAEAAYEPACKQYQTAVDAFRSARLRLMALDLILDRSGGFSSHHLGIELRHQRAAPNEIDVHHGLGATVASMRKSLGG
jgi:hypothetical protein